MDNCWRTAAEDSIGPIFGTMAHTVMATITRKNQGILLGLEIIHQFTLVLLPVHVYSWEQFVLEMENIVINYYICSMVTTPQHAESITRTFTSVVVSNLI